MDINTNYEKFKELLRTEKREGIEDLISFLDKTDMRVAPASTRFHLSEEGGLVQHCLNVCAMLEKRVKEVYGELEETKTDKCPYTLGQVRMLALLHDLSKTQFYEKYMRNVKNEETGEWEKKPEYKVKDPENRLVYGSHAQNAEYMVSGFLKLTREESAAILWHMGTLSHDESDKQVGICGDVYRKYPIAYLLHSSDMDACYLIETGSIKI